MTARPEQLALDLAHRVANGRDDFLVSPSNAAAVRLVDEWPAWPSHVAILTGPHGSGKSHLAQVWQARSGASVLKAAELARDEVAEAFASKALVLEDVTPGAFDETMLFHVANFARQEGGQVLLTSSFEPGQWNVKLPDLASRLNSFPVIRIGAPDDALLRGVLVKLFADRQIAVDEALISYVVTRMPRSLDAARKLVAEIDRLALAEKAEVTRSFVSRVMGKLLSPGLFNDA
jgi:chromosomal replication initiation ATPase DnaA